MISKEKAVKVIRVVITILTALLGVLVGKGL
jgi:uncharacterized membrane protein YqaE (UPF0057 family)